MTQRLRGWLEPGRTDPDLGLRAATADPAWFLARQWEMGEFQGEDASAPVAVYLTPEHRPLTYDPTRPHLDPTVIPAEALVEAEPGDWWTVGRRARLGRLVAGRLAEAEREACRFGPMPVPYEELAELVDGRAAFEAGLLPGDAVWDEVPSPPPDRFSRSLLTHSATFTAGDLALDVRGHRGGDLDWFSVSGAGPVDPPEDPPTAPSEVGVLPTRLTFPGAPHPRWWQIEDAAVDLGTFAPDRSHLATMLLADLSVVHAEDWFVFPVPAQLADDGTVPPSSGVLVRLGDMVTVRDAFGFEHEVGAPTDWSLYRVDGLAATDLVVWPVAVAPHTGPLLDDVVIGIDEDANLTWAIELRAEGRELLEGVRSDVAAGETTRTGTREFTYRPMTTLPERWHPYVRHEDVGWRQGVLADLTGPVPRPRPGPVSWLIGGPSGDGLGDGHELAPTAVPSSGVRLRRRSLLARDTNGRPVLWVERSVVPVAGPPTSHLRWDVMVEARREEIAAPQAGPLADLP